MIFSRSSLHHFITPQWVLPINEKHDLCSRGISIFFSSYEIKLALWNKLQNRYSFRYLFDVTNSFFIISTTVHTQSLNV